MGEVKPNGAAQPPTVMNMNKLLNELLTAQSNALIANGVPPMVVADRLLEAAANLISGVEPPAQRSTIISSVLNSLPVMIEEYHRRRNTTPGGLIVARNLPGMS